MTNVKDFSEEENRKSENVLLQFLSSNKIKKLKSINKKQKILQLIFQVLLKCPTFFFHRSKKKQKKHEDIKRFHTD